MLQDAVALLREVLPPLWVPVYHDGNLNVLKFSCSPALVTQRSIIINSAGEVKYYAHGKPLKENHGVYSCSSVDCSSASALADAASAAVSKFRLYDVCCGVPKIMYKKFWKSTENSKIDSNIFQEIRYTETCRSTACDIIVNQSQRMCKQCVQLSKNLSQRAKNNKEVIAGKTVTPSKSKPYKYLITPEKRARDHRKTVRINNLQKQNARLRERMDFMIENEGTEVSATTDEELRIILNSAQSHPNTTPLQRLFMEQQLKACSMKDRRSMKWHPMMIRLALRIRMISSSAYNELCESGFLVMPSQRTLYDYSHAFEVTEGLCRPIINDVAETVNTFKHDYQRYHVLMFDEVYITEKVVQNKATGDVVGYCHLTEVQQEFEEFEKLMKATAEGVQVEETKAPPVAKRILSYLLKGTASSVGSVVASYPVATLKKETLMEYTWEVIEALEAKDLRVIALIADGSSVNRGFFDMHPPAVDEGFFDGDDPNEAVPVALSEGVYCTQNVFAPERLIYFISDLPHLVKTARNCLYNSGKKKSRNMKKNGEYLTWSTIVQLFNEKKDQTLKKLHKLDAACVYLNSYSRMKCLYAFRIFSGSLSNAVLAKKWPGTTELGIFGKI